MPLSAHPIFRPPVPGASRAALALAVVLVAAVPPLASAAPPPTYALSAEIVSFRSWFNLRGPTTVNGQQLTLSSTLGGIDSYGEAYNWSNTISFSPGTTSLSFGYNANYMNGFDVAAGGAVTTPNGVPFNLATLTYTNGFYWQQAEIGVHFVAQNLSGGPANVFDGLIELTSTNPPGVDPFQQADYFCLTSTLADYTCANLVNGAQLGSVRVFERDIQPPGTPAPGNTGSATLTAMIGSLDPLAFTSPTGGAFLDSSTSANLNDPHVGSVPEPGTGVMFLVGALVLRAARRKVIAT